MGTVKEQKSRKNQGSTEQFKMIKTHIPYIKKEQRK